MPAGLIGDQGVHDVIGQDAPQRVTLEVHDQQRGTAALDQCLHHLRGRCVGVDRNRRGRTDQLRHLRIRLRHEELEQGDVVEQAAVLVHDDHGVDVGPVLLGVPEAGSRLDFDPSEFVTREVSVIPSNAATESETRRALSLIRSGRIDVASLVTHRFPLVEFARAVSVAQKAECVKALITP